MFARVILHDHVKLRASEIGRNYREFLLAKLRRDIEGRCTRHGFIVPDTTTFLKCSVGKLDGASLNGDVQFEVEYSALVCNPPIGAVVQAKVVNINKFGILAHGGSSAHGDQRNGDVELPDILEIIVAKQGMALTSDIDLELVRIGDVVNVEILGKRFQLNDNRISIVGKVIGHETGSKGLTAQHEDDELDAIVDTSENDSANGDELDDEDVSDDGKSAADSADGKSSVGDDENDDDDDDDDDELDDDLDGNDDVYLTDDSAASSDNEA